MKRWRYAINSYHKTATIFCGVASFHIFWLENFASTICAYLIPAVPFPKIPLKLKNDEIEDNDGKRWTTWKDWYGSLDQWFHVYVHMPIFDFCYKYIKSYSIKVPYHKLKKSFYEMDKDFWDEDEQFTEKMKQEETKIR